MEIRNNSDRPLTLYPGESVEIEDVKVVESPQKNKELRRPAEFDALEINDIR